MRFENYGSIAESAAHTVRGFYECYEQSIFEIEGLDRQIGRIEVERASSRRSRLHRDEMRKLQDMRRSLVDDRDYYSRALQRVNVLMESVVHEDKLLKPDRY